MSIFGIREKVCFELSRRLIKPPPPRNTSPEDYEAWRYSELEGQWKHFSNEDVRGKDVLDFGCGGGALSFILARHGPRRIVGVDLEETAIRRCDALKQQAKDPQLDCVSFHVGSPSGIPVEDKSFDTLLAFDCVEHIMEPEPIMRDWKRVLRPGGKVLIWWSPYRSPYGPHMESVIPIPWAHVIFGERAMIKTAARIYDSEEFVVCSWHLDENGVKKPNQWKQWSTFKDQGYLNQLTAGQFQALAARVGLEVTRFEPHSFQGTPVRKLVGGALVRVPVVGEYMTSFYIVECTRPLH